MSHTHKPWKPSPATKPSHLTSSAAALQGATSAFSSSPATTTSNVNAIRSRYETSLPTQPTKESRGRSPGKDNDETTARGRWTPSRGPHLSPENAQLAGSLSSTSNVGPPAPAVLSRNPSMIAARLASASPSPVRDSGKTSPSKEWEKSAPIPQGDRSALLNPGQTRPAAHKSQLSQSNVPNIRAVPTNGQLDFAKIPRLSARTNSDNVQSYSASEAATHIDTGFSMPHNSTVTPIPMASKNSNSPSGSKPSTISASPVDKLDSNLLRPIPPAPAPRKGRIAARSPLTPNPTGSKQANGFSREEVINRMADAMVASSLASRRTPSPTKAYTGLSTRRRSASAHNIGTVASAEEIRPSFPRKPARQMKHTLRRGSSDDEEEGVEMTKRGRRHLVRKHPNMHHEGDRRRWRDKVTEMERRRYEGVFAANRGLLLKSVDPKSSPSRLIDPTAENQLVVNVVCRDIFERSRLPAQVLEQIYELVAPDDELALNREQFVVGLWLVDQKLKGRKLPVTVSESVWESVRHSQGIKMRTR